MPGIHSLQYGREKLGPRLGAAAAEMIASRNPRPPTMSRDIEITILAQGRADCAHVVGTKNDSWLDLASLDIDPWSRVETAFDAQIQAVEFCSFT